MIPAHVINLERATDRRLRMEAEWRPVFGPGLTFFPAVDRRSIENGEVADLSCRPYGQSVRRRLTYGETACLASHLSLLRQCLATTDAPFAIVMEDDVVPIGAPRCIASEITRISSSNITPDVLLMFRPSNRYGMSGGDDPIGILAPPFPWGTCMVAYSRHGMHKYIEAFSDFPSPADHWHILAAICRISILRNPIAKHIGTDTYVGNEHRGPGSQRNYLP